MKPISQGALGENPQGPIGPTTDHTGRQYCYYIPSHYESSKHQFLQKAQEFRHSVPLPVVGNPSKSQLFHTACLGLLNAEFPFNRTANNKNIKKHLASQKNMCFLAEISQVEELIPCLGMINRPPWNEVVKHPTLQQSSNQFVNLRHTDVLNQHFRTKVLASRIFLPSPAKIIPSHVGSSATGNGWGGAGAGTRSTTKGCDLQ